MSTKFYGKYRGIVTNNLDPSQLGRIKAKVPDVFGDTIGSWAMPCGPCNASGEIGSALPPIGAGVWIEFESGDPSRPIWAGCFWNTDETPPAYRNSLAGRKKT